MSLFLTQALRFMSSIMCLIADLGFFWDFEWDAEPRFEEGRRSALSGRVIFDLRFLSLSLQTLRNFLCGVAA